MLSPRNGLFARGFAADQCNQCGRCIAGCLYLGLSAPQARDLMKKATRAPEWLPDFAACVTCGKCDYRCPQDAHPARFMLECLEHKRRREREVPPSLAYAVNGMGAEGWTRNFFKDIFQGLGKEEQRILDEWARPKKSRDMLWAGCGFRMLPKMLEESPALDNLAKFGGPDDCCGVFAVKGGLLEEGYRIAQRLIKRLSQSRFDRLVVACGHCQKMFDKVMPGMLGLTFPFPTISIFEYLAERIAAGKARVAHPLNVEASMSDACFGYEIGPAYLDAVRSLADRIGMTVSELPHNREDAACCGLGAYLTDGRVSSFVKTARIKRRDLAAAGKKHVVSYCQGCHLLIHYAQPGYTSHFLLEDALAALEEKPSTPNSILHRRLLRPHIAWHMAAIARSALK